jgi:hypothetical protein
MQESFIHPMTVVSDKAESVFRPSQRTADVSLQSETGKAFDLTPTEAQLSHGCLRKTADAVRKNRKVLFIVSIPGEWYMQW